MTAKDTKIAAPELCINTFRETPLKVCGKARQGARLQIPKCELQFFKAVGVIAVIISEIC